MSLIAIHDIGTLVEFALGVAVLLLAVAGIACGVRWWWQRRRTLLLQEAARELGYSFQPHLSRDFNEQLAGFTLLNYGHSRRARNVLHQQRDGMDIWCFDFSYSTGGGDWSSHYRQSVVAFRAEHLKLAHFVMRPVELLDLIGKMFGGKDIDFAARPRFSATYQLLSKDEAATRSIFDDTLMDACEQYTDVHLEGRGQWLIYHRNSEWLVPTSDMGGYLREACQFLALVGRERIANQG